jgi:G:T-mismatch repair DNA endonuclease (very short patch repair protein)
MAAAKTEIILRKIKRRVTHDERHEGRLEPSGQKVLPVNVPEECLFFNVFGVVLAGSQAALRIFPQQLQIEMGKLEFLP